MVHVGGGTVAVTRESRPLRGAVSGEAPPEGPRGPRNDAGSLWHTPPGVSPGHASATGPPPSRVTTSSDSVWWSSRSAWRSGSGPWPDRGSTSTTSPSCRPARTTRSTGTFLGRNYGGHLMPGGWLVIKGLSTWAPYHWSAWAGFLVLGQLVASLGMLRLLREHVRRHPLVLVLLAGYCFLIFTLPAGIWFAAGINQLPLQVALVFGLHAHLAYLRTHRLAVPRRHPRLDGLRARLLREGPAAVRLLRALRPLLVRPRDAGRAARAGCGATTASGSSPTAPSPSPTSRST